MDLMDVFMKIDLRSVRNAANLTQKEMGKKFGLTQPEIARLERRRDHYISTLAAYVSSLGGRLKIVAEVNKKEIVIYERSGTCRLK